MALLTGMFEFAWRPFFLTHAKDPNAKLLFSRVMTYYLVACAVVFLLLSFFLEHVIRYPILAGRYILPPEYWSGLPIIPLILLSYVVSGIGTNLNAGIQIEKKTGYLFPTSLAGSVSKVVLTFVLVPPFGIMGAAYATLIGYLVSDVSLYFVVQRIYYIRYEFGRIAKLFLSVGAVYAASELLEAGVYLKVLLFLLWCGSLAVIGFFTPGELGRIRSLLRKSP